MIINKTQNVSFGTTPSMGVMSIGGLRKYNIKLAKGILAAFDELSKNGANDEFNIHMGRKIGAKDMRTDAMDVRISKDNAVKSSMSLSPKSLQKLSAKEISDKLISAYQKLLNSSQKKYNVTDYPNFYKRGNIAKFFGDLSPKSKLVDNPKYNKIIKTLTEKYGDDDWGCA